MPEGEAGGPAARKAVEEDVVLIDQRRRLAGKRGAQQAAGMFGEQGRGARPRASHKSTGLRSGWVPRKGHEPIVAHASLHLGVDALRGEAGETRAALGTGCPERLRDARQGGVEGRAAQRLPLVDLRHQFRRRHKAQRQPVGKAIPGALWVRRCERLFQRVELDAQHGKSLVEAKARAVAVDGGEIILHVKRYPQRLERLRGIGNRGLDWILPCHP